MSFVPAFADTTDMYYTTEHGVNLTKVAFRYKFFILVHQLGFEPLTP